MNDDLRAVAELAMDQISAAYDAPSMGFEDGFDWQEKITNDLAAQTDFTAEEILDAINVITHEHEPDWARYQSPEEAYREAMDYELNAEYDRWDGHREDFGDEHDYDDEPLDAGYYPQPADHWAYLDRTPIVYGPDDDDVPF